MSEHAVVSWHYFRDVGLCWVTVRVFPMGKRWRTFLLNQLLCLEETPQIEHLPCCQSDETEHGEDAEIQHTYVGGLWSMGGENTVSGKNKNTYLNKLQKEIAHLTIGVSHLFLPLLHISKIIDDRLGQILQSPQLNFQRLQFLHLGNLGDKTTIKENQQQSTMRK